MSRDQDTSSDLVHKESLVFFSPVTLSGKARTDSGAVIIGGTGSAQEKYYTLYNVSNSAVSLGHVLGDRGRVIGSLADDDDLPRSRKKWIVENQDISDLYDILKRVADRPLPENGEKDQAVFLSSTSASEISGRLHIGAGVLGAYTVVLFAFLWGVGEITNIVFIQPIIALFGLVAGGTFVLMEIASRCGWEP